MAAAANRRSSATGTPFSNSFPTALYMRRQRLLRRYQIYHCLLPFVLAAASPSASITISPSIFPFPGINQHANAALTLPRDPLLSNLLREPTVAAPGHLRRPPVTNLLRVVDPFVKKEMVFQKKTIHSSLQWIVGVDRGRRNHQIRPSEKPAALIVDSASSPSDSIEPKVDQLHSICLVLVIYVLVSVIFQGKQEIKKPKYVQISFESYSHLTGLEDQVKSLEEQVSGLEDEVKDLNKKLAAAQSEMTNKENLVKQHAKVAEESVSGWEKAESEAATLKNHLESVTLLKLTNEDRASHLDGALKSNLDGALKECMRRIQNLKEENEQKLHDVIQNKTKQLDKMKHEFEAKLANLDQQLLRFAAKNSALSRSLQERSSMVIQLSEEKAQAEAEIEMLKSNIESCEREINSLKYELHINSKELEIRIEEKNMSVRSAEVANKQHLEGVKKIAKLEVECQRLRGLVWKKLPRPTALSQMNLEVESLGRDYGDSRVKKSQGGRPSSPQFSSLSDFSLDSVQKFHKENE
ncbi:hypothetical protein P3S67_011494 [Capsicum chacoense]